MCVLFACAPENQHVIFYVFLGPVLKGASDYTTENGPAANRPAGKFGDDDVSRNPPRRWPEMS